MDCGRKVKKKSETAYEILKINMHIRYLHIWSRALEEREKSAHAILNPLKEH